jgi:hypothetical protein
VGKSTENIQQHKESVPVSASLPLYSQLIRKKQEYFTSDNILNSRKSVLFTNP